MWQQLDSGRVTHRFESVILVATLAIPVMVIELEASSSGWREFAFAANWVPSARHAAGEAMGRHRHRSRPRAGSQVLRRQRRPGEA